MRNIIEELRSYVLEQAMGLSSMTKDWPDRKEKINSYFKSKKRPRKLEIWGLGDHLSKIFKCVSGGGRTQSGVSRAGTVWEVLVLYYLNICLLGTCAVVVKKDKHTPKSIVDALKITQHGSLIKSDLDLVVISCPALKDVPSIGSEAKCLEKLNSLIEQNFGDVFVCNIQCKTNWKDNSQTPMLWNLLFEEARGKRPLPQGLVIGSGLYEPSLLQGFAYSFVTVPTGQDVTAGDVQCYRTKNMTGGMFWGKPTKAHVSKSIKEFFVQHYGLAPHHFPDPSQIGVGYESKAKDLPAACFKL